jgi:hypothetical protein
VPRVAQWLRGTAGIARTPVCKILLKYVRLIPRGRTFGVGLKSFDATAPAVDSLRSAGRRCHRSFTRA